MFIPLQLPQTTFDLRAILQKRDNLRDTSDKIKYEITASQDFKLKKGKISEYFIEIIAQ